MSPRAVRKEKLDLRLSSTDKRTLEAAASVSSRSLSDFVRESALSRADEMLSDRRTFVLSKAKWTEFQAALDAPTRRIPRMQRLLSEPGFFDADLSSIPSKKR
ncbi:MAG: DUF1778 domain-containing protein [Nitrospira sp.]|nr:DUF1778 domain-containing protein [Nitrospira sp.]